MPHLTDAVIKRLPLPAKGNRSPATTRKFGARVTANGNKAFVFNYTTKDGVERRYTIRRIPRLSTTAARARAGVAPLTDAGGDPLPTSRTRVLHRPWPN
jgi:hypothetical protein